MSILIRADEFQNELATHQKYARSQMLLNLVWTHSVIIAEMAQSLLEAQNKLKIYPPLAIQAALMHEVGVYVCSGFEWLTDQPVYDRPYAHHSVIGAWILWSERFAPEVVRTALHHPGMGLTQQDIQQFSIDLPAGNYVPNQPVEQLIAYVAKYHSKTPKFRTADQIRTSISKYGPEKVAIFDAYLEQFGEPDIAFFEDKYKDWHNGFTYSIENQSNVAPTMLNPAGVSSGVTATKKSKSQNKQKEN